MASAILQLTVRGKADSAERGNELSFVPNSTVLGLRFQFPSRLKTPDVTELSVLSLNQDWHPAHTSRVPKDDSTPQLGAHSLDHHSTAVPQLFGIKPRRLFREARLSNQHSPSKLHKRSSAKPWSARGYTMCLELYCYFRCIHCSTTQLEEDTMPCTQGLISNQTCPQKKVVGARDWRCCKMCRSGSGRNCWCRVQPGLRVRK